MSDGNIEPAKKRGRPRIHPKSEPYNKIGSGVPLRSQAREMVCRVRQYFQLEKINKGPLLPVDHVVKRTCAALKVGKNTVVTVTKEKNMCQESGSKLRTPSKKVAKTKRVTGLDAFQTDAIRRHIYSYILRKDYVTLKKLHVSLQNANLFGGCKSSLAILLKRLNFRYKKFGNRKCLMERGDIVAWRCRFLREIKQENFDDIIWLDETWINTGHSKKQGWTDDTVQGTMQVPIGKGGRVIILHAGSSTGFVPNCLLMFTSKKTSDYHEEMNNQKFYEWFNESLLPNLEKPSIIVMDNAKYHSRVLDKPPTLNSRKSELLEWLRTHGVSFQVDMKKAELLELVRLNKPQFPKYVIDELAKQKGHRIIRLPPYHCHFNSIELIWAQIKNFVAQNNKAFNISEIKELTKEAIKNIGPSKWKKVVDHTKQVILESWEKEGLLDEAVDEMIISINIGESSSSSEEDDGVEEGSEDIDEVDFDCEIVEDESESEFSGVCPLSPAETRSLDFTEY